MQRFYISDDMCTHSNLRGNDEFCDGTRSAECYDDENLSMIPLDA